MTAPAPTAPTPAAPTPLDHARRLGPAIRARSAEIEDLRRLPDDLVDTLHDAGLFRFWVPSELGGPEVSPAEGFDAIIELATHDTSVAWCVFIANSTALAGGILPHDHARAIWSDPRSVAGGFAAPVGRARVVDGGLSVSGRWQWGSGTSHCSTIGGGFLVVDEHGEVAAHDDGLLAGMAFMDASEVTLLDTWHVLGVRGSGSTDYECRDVFVPEGKWLNMLDLSPVVAGPMYHISFFAMLGAGIACTAIGVGRRALEEFHTLALGKVPQGSGRTMSERPAVQGDRSRAEAVLGSAEAYLRATFAEAWTVVTSGEEMDLDLRRRLRLAITDATQRCCDTVSRLHRLAGGEAVYRRSPLERLFRDANVVSQHAMAAERTYELFGRLAFGLETDTTTL